jgi:membrane-associated phospholipid phosphatase
MKINFEIKEKEKIKLKKFLLGGLFVIFSYQLVYFISSEIIYNTPFFKDITEKIMSYENITNILNIGIKFNYQPFFSFMIIIYFGSFFWWTCITPFLIYKYLDKNTIMQLFYSSLLFLFVAIIIFFIFPFKIYEQDQWGEQIKYVDNFLNSTILFLYKIEYKRNLLLPSIHVSNSWFCFIVFRGENKKKLPKSIIFIQFFLAILVYFSTFLLKQHYILDGIISIILVEFVYFIVKKNL